MPITTRTLRLVESVPSLFSISWRKARLLVYQRIDKSLHDIQSSKTPAERNSTSTKSKALLLETFSQNRVAAEMPKDVKKESGKGSRLASHNPLLISPREAEEAFLPCFLKPRTPKLSNHVLDATIPWTAPHLLQKTTISSLSLSG